MTKFDWAKARRTEDVDNWAKYGKDWEAQRKKDNRNKLLNGPPTKTQLRYIAKLRRERDYMVKMFPETRRKASALIRELEQAPYKVW